MISGARSVHKDQGGMWDIRHVARRDFVLVVSVVFGVNLDRVRVHIGGMGCTGECCCRAALDDSHLEEDSGVGLGGQRGSRVRVRVVESSRGIFVLTVQYHKGFEGHMFGIRRRIALPFVFGRERSQAVPLVQVGCPEGPRSAVVGGGRVFLPGLFVLRPRRLPFRSVRQKDFFSGFNVSECHNFHEESDSVVLFVQDKVGW